MMALKKPHLKFGCHKDFGAAGRLRCRNTYATQAATTRVSLANNVLDRVAAKGLVLLWCLLEAFCPGSIVVLNALQHFYEESCLQHKMIFRVSKMAALGDYKPKRLRKDVTQGLTARSDEEPFITSERRSGYAGLE